MVEEPGHSQRIQTLDGLRAIAILLVICDHCVPRVLTAHGLFSSVILEASAWAGCGVDLFFVLSGFLITGILLDAKGSANYFRRFYWRRSLRIFPAFYLLLLFTVIFMPILFGRIGLPWFALYLRNWLGADRASDGTLGHLWSLAVEEQFYIVWSVIVFLCPSRHLFRAILILAATAPVVRTAMHFAGYPGYLIFHVTPARTDSLLCGALVVSMVRSGSAGREGKRIALAGIQIGFFGLLGLRLYAGAISSDVTAYQIAWPSLIAISFASILLLCLNLHHKGAIYAFLTCAVLRVVAKYSYAIYLWHLVAALIAILPLRFLAQRFSLAPNGAGYVITFVLLTFILSFGVAALSWLLIERPALSLKDRLFQKA